jgi:glycosyltransferase involved in cell wall biosynthesis
MPKPLVSILIPTFNSEHFIGETLESALNQTWSNIEVVVVNDGSTDQTAREIERCSSSKVIVVHQRNRGQTAALNVCLARARGQFIQYLDADDLISSDKIERQLHRLIGQPGCIASAEWGRFYSDPKDTKFLPEEVSQDLSPLDWLALSRRDGLGMMFPALWLLPRCIVEAVGGWREDLSLNNDAEYFTRVLLHANRVLFCPGAKCYYRSGVAGSLSGRKSSAAWQSQFAVNELCQQYVLARENSERMRRGFALSWQHLAHASYPYNRTLAERALAQARALHPARIWPDGGTTFRILSRVLGWRLARRLQVASGRP